MRRWILALLMGLVAISGCAGGGGGGGGGQQGQGTQQVSDDQVRKAVRESFADNQTKDFISSLVKLESGHAAMEKALDTQEGQKALSQAVQQSITNPAGQQAMADAFGKMIENPKFKAQFQLLIRNALQEIMMRGVQGGGQGGGQQGGGGQGDGDQGGGGGGGDQKQGGGGGGT
jgi:hypothetical protein